jgi:hypothetical protein
MKLVFTHVGVRVDLSLPLSKSFERPSLWNLGRYSSVARFQVTVLGGSISCLVTLMVLDFGRVIYLT